MRSPAAIVLIVFNRPRLTRLSFSAIRQQRPERLLVVADGPRNGHPDDEALCEEVRHIVSEVDWPCDASYNLAKTNMGLKNRVVSGLDWAFSLEESAIILEDDCVAHPDFFGFAGELLDIYEHDERVSVITGNNFQAGLRRGTGSYYFSKYNHCWGWATWRRAWSLNDPDMRFWPEWSTSQEWRETVPDPVERVYWHRVFDRAHAGEIDTWDYQWTASVWFRGGLTATPNVNLVSNIGFGVEATHTRAARSNQADLPTHSLGLIRHPDEVAQDVAADRFVFDHHFEGQSMRDRRRPLGFIRWLVSGSVRKTRRMLTGLHGGSTRTSAPPK